MTKQTKFRIIGFLFGFFIALLGFTYANLGRSYDIYAIRLFNFPGFMLAGFLAGYINDLSFRYYNFVMYLIIPGVSGLIYSYIAYYVGKSKLILGVFSSALVILMILIFFYPPLIYSSGFGAFTSDEDLKNWVFKGCVGIGADLPDNPGSVDRGPVSICYGYLK